MARRNLGNCCLCCPLQRGVVMICVLCFFAGLWNFIVLFMDDIRLQFNGYTRTLRKMEVIVGTFHLLFALLGLIGVLDNKIGLVKTFAYFLLVHTLCYAFLFACDILLLFNHCGPQDAFKPDQFNPSIDIIARKGLCNWAQRSYMIGFLMSFCVRIYFWYVTRLFVQKASRTVPFLIQFGSRQHKNDHMQVVVSMDDEHPGDYMDKDNAEAQAMAKQIEQLDQQKRFLVKEFGTVRKYGT